MPHPNHPCIRSCASQPGLTTAPVAHTPCISHAPPLRMLPHRLMIRRASPPRALPAVHSLEERRALGQHDLAQVDLVEAVAHVHRRDDLEHRARKEEHLREQRSQR